MADEVWLVWSSQECDEGRKLLAVCSSEGVAGAVVGGVMVERRAVVMSPPPEFADVVSLLCVLGPHGLAVRHDQADAGRARIATFEAYAQLSWRSSGHCHAVAYALSRMDAELLLQLEVERAQAVYARPAALEAAIAGAREAERLDREIAELDTKHGRAS